MLAQLIHDIDECRMKLLRDAALIEETKKLFTTSSDDNLVEFSCIILHYVCDDPKYIDAMGRDEIFMQNVFNHLRSHDVDILLNSMRLLNVIMRNSMLIAFVLNVKDFPFKNLQAELKNDCHEIRLEALEGILLISDIHQEHPFVEELTMERFVDVIYGICMVNLLFYTYFLLLTFFFYSMMKNPHKIWLLKSTRIFAAMKN